MPLKPIAANPAPLRHLRCSVNVSIYLLICLTEIVIRYTQHMQFVYRADCGVSGTLFHWHK